MNAAYSDPELSAPLPLRGLPLRAPVTLHKMFGFPLKHRSLRSRTLPANPVFPLRSHVLLTVLNVG